MLARSWGHDIGRLGSLSVGRLPASALRHERESYSKSGVHDLRSQRLAGESRAGDYGRPSTGLGGGVGQGGVDITMELDSHTAFP